MKCCTIDKKQLVGTKPVGVIFGMAGSERYKNVVLGYFGDVPAKIATNLDQLTWDKMAEGKLTPLEISTLKMQGMI